VSNVTLRAVLSVKITTTRMVQEHVKYVQVDAWSAMMLTAVQNVHLSSIGMEQVQPKVVKAVPPSTVMSVKHLDQLQSVQNVMLVMSWIHVIIHVKDVVTIALNVTGLDLLPNVQTVMVAMSSTRQTHVNFVRLVTAISAGMIHINVVPVPLDM
jgi:hypothetical protein